MQPRNVVLMFAVAFLTMSTPSFAQDNTAVTSVMESVSEQLASMRRAQEATKFDDRNAALTGTNRAVEYLTQAQAGIEQLAGTATAGNAQPYRETGNTLDEMQELLERQRRALITNDESAFGLARNDFNELYTEIPVTVRIQ